MLAIPLDLEGHVISFRNGLGLWWYVPHLTGVAINFVPDDDVSDIRRIERFYDTKIDVLPMRIDEVIKAL